MKKKILLVGFLVFLVISSLTSKTVRVGWYEAEGLQDGQCDDDLGGYNYEYLCRIAQYTGWELEFVYRPWKECEKLLIAGEIDIIGDVAITEERKALYNYCKIPNGESRMLLVCSKDNNSLTYDDFASFDGLTVATIPSTFREYLLEELGKEKNFQVSFKTYNTHEEIFNAIEEEAEAAIFSNVTNYDFSKFKVITIFEPNPFYFVVNKDQSETLEELNNAIESIKTNDIFFDQKLFNKYFMQDTENSEIALTKEEIDFVNSKKTVIVGYNENDAPFSSQDNETGQMEVIVADFLSLIEKKSGLEFEYKPYPNNEELLQGIKNQEFDVKYAALNDIEKAKQNNQNLTQSYLTIQSGILFKANNISEIKTLAIVKDSINSEFGKNSTYQIKEYDTYSACLKALDKGEVASVLIDTYFYEMISSYQKYKNMSFKLLPSFQNEICFGISKNKENHKLYTIFEKSIGNIGITEKNSILLDNKSLIVNLTFWDKIANNIVIIIIFIFISVLMIIIICILYRSIRQKRKNEITLTKQNYELKKVTNRLNYLNHQLEKTVREANAANEAKTNFLLSVSHDIRTPMNAIIAMTNLALLDLNNKKQMKESLDITKMASLQLLDLINNLLDMSSIERGTLELNETQHFNIKVEAENIKRQMKQIAEDKGLNLLVKTKITHEHVVSDLQQLRRVILNLINNSMKYTLREGTVTFSIIETDFSKIPKEVFKEDSSYRVYSICVSDNGIGMTKKQASHVFEKFYQANQSNNINKTQGVGLGLSISKEIVTMMHGTISVSSTAKVGTTFIVNIPLKTFKGTEDGENLIIASNIENKDSIDYNFNGKKALIVDDNEINLLVLKRILQQSKMEVTLARNGKEAVEQFINSKNEEFSIILIDISMPITDGYEATKEIRQSNHPNGKTIPIVAVTANTFDNNEQNLIKAGMQGHILKPIKIKDLMSLLQKLIK